MHADTRDRILIVAEAAVRRTGWAAFSYADVAERVGIRKPSVHHHFPAKEDLGVALVDSYVERFSVALADIANASPCASTRLRAYSGLYRRGLLNGEGCLCGVLASESAALPARMRAAVRRFFDLNLDWLARVAKEGQAAGAIRPDLAPRAIASTVLAGLEGAMLVSLAVGSVQNFDRAATAILTSVGSAPC
jgi:TetR/AcrR family transcriptional repressor of nem operon